MIGKTTCMLTEACCLWQLGMPREQTNARAVAATLGSARYRYLRRGHPQAPAQTPAEKCTKQTISPAAAQGGGEGAAPP